MSKSYMVLLIDDPDAPCKYCGTGGLPGGACEHCMNTGLENWHGEDDIDGQSAKVFMRFTEEPDESFLKRLAIANPGKRVYCLSGASTWHSIS